MQALMTPIVVTNNFKQTNKKDEFNNSRHTAEFQPLCLCEAKSPQGKW